VEPAATETWPDRLRHLHEWLLMPRPPDYEWVALPSWARPAYYAVRPVRLLLRRSLPASPPDRAK
jgi:hypothetical protein